MTAIDRALAALESAAPADESDGTNIGYGYDRLDSCWRCLARPPGEGASGVCDVCREALLAEVYEEPRSQQRAVWSCGRCGWGYEMIGNGTTDNMADIRAHQTACAIRFGLSPAQQAELAERLRPAFDRVIDYVQAYGETLAAAGRAMAAVFDRVDRDPDGHLVVEGRFVDAEACGNVPASIEAPDDIEWSYSEAWHRSDQVDAVALAYGSFLLSAAEVRAQEGLVVENLGRREPWSTFRDAVLAGRVRLDGSEHECPQCVRLFTSAGGLQAHVDHMHRPARFPTISTPRRPPDWLMEAIEALGVDVLPYQRHILAAVGLPSPHFTVTDVGEIQQNVPLPRPAPLPASSGEVRFVRGPREIGRPMAGGPFAVIYERHDFGEVALPAGPEPGDAVFTEAEPPPA